MLLARQGLRVLAIDRQAHGSDTLSTHALMRAGVLQLARWGVLPAIIAAGTPEVRTTTFRYAEDSVTVEIRPDHGVAALCAPRRTVIDRVLVDAARAAGADVRHGAILANLVFGAGDRVVGAAIRDDAGALHQVRAPIVIGADGRHSTVAERVGAATYRQSAHRTAAVYGHFSGLADEGYRWFYDVGVSAGAIPTNGGACVFAALPPARFKAEMAGGADALFARVVAETSPGLAAEMAHATPQGRLRGFPGQPGHIRQSHGPGWALVGDAAYFKDPLTAHGITDALRDAELLARAVLAGSRAAMARYQDERDALSHDLFEVTDEIASFAWSLDQVKEMHLRLNKAMKAETAALAGFGPAMSLAA
jgi:2-polyprenyl-6-methoxyphenol hydroxylase-like FAD-dependent oxidoreductase